MATATAEAGEWSVRYGGKEYATLDFTPPRTASTGAAGGQSELMEVPDGWSLAETSEGVVGEVIAKFPWGADFLVLGNGDTHRTSATFPPGGSGLSGFLVQEGRRFKPTNPSARVLICAEVCAADGDYCAQALTRLWESRKFADCEVVCNGQVFQCHRAVLAQASPVFSQMLSGEMVEAKAQRIQLEALENETEAVAAFLAFVYTGTLDCKSEYFPTVVKLADFYQLDCITAKTCNGMLRALDKGNVVPMVRLLKTVREKPRVGPYWTKLADKVQQSKELTIAVMSGV